MSNENRSDQWSNRAIRALAGAVVIVLVAPHAFAAPTVAWSPASSERLIKLPASHLKKAVERDFARSPLAMALADADGSVRLKVQTLEDIRSAIDRTDGDLKIELRHQFLAEKQAYLHLVAHHHDLRRKHAKAKVRLYERLLVRLGRDGAQMTPQRVSLIEKQEHARQRFESSAPRVDTALFRSALTSESRYAREYAKNLAAVERLVQAVNAHPMNEHDDIDGNAVGKADYVRHLIASSEAELAILGQEENILGFMAKLVSLDALALSETVASETTEGEPEDGPKPGLVSSVEFFVAR